MGNAVQKTNATYNKISVTFVKLAMVLYSIEVILLNVRYVFFDATMLDKKALRRLTATLDVEHVLFVSLLRTLYFAKLLLKTVT